MDEREREEILWRLDERTERVDQHLTQLDRRVQQVEDDIDDVQGTVRRNSTILGFIGTGATAISLWAADKVSRFL